MMIPLLYYLFTQLARRWLKVAFAVAIVLCAFSALGSHSRGALVAIGAMAAFFWLKSHNKVMIGVAIAVLLPVLVDVHARALDGSACTRSRSIGRTSEILGRSADSHVDHALPDRERSILRRRFSNPIPKELYAHLHARLATGCTRPTASTSQVLGEHGWVGLALFLVDVVVRCGDAARWIIRAARNRQDLKWAASLSAMIQVSLVGYFVGGTFLNLAYWDFPYYELVISF